MNFNKAVIFIALVSMLSILCYCGVKPSQKNYMEYKNQAVSLAHEDSCVKAIELGRKLLKFNEKDAEIYSLMAECFYKLEQGDSAVFYYQGAIVFNPSDRKSYERVGDVYFEAGDYHNAMAWYDMALQISYVSSQSFTRLGVISQSWHEYNHAKTYYNYALVTDSANYDALYGLGTVELTQGDTNSAILNLAKAAGEGKNAIAAYKLGELHWQMGKYDEAIDWLDKCFEYSDDQLLKDKAYQLKMEIIVKRKAGQ